MASGGSTVSRAAPILIGAVIFAAAGWFAWQHRPAVAEWLISGVLAANGLSDAELAVAHIDLNEMTLVDGRIGDAGLEFREVRVSYALRKLVLGRLGDIEIVGLRLPATLGDDGIEIAGLEDLLAGDDAAAQPIDPPFDSVRLSESELALATAFGKVSVAFEGVVRTAASGGLTGSLNLEQRSAAADSSSTLHFEISADGATKGEIQLRNAVVNLTDRGLVANLAGSGSFEGGADGLKRLSGDIVLRHVMAGDINVPDAVFEVGFQAGALFAHGILYGPDNRPEFELHTVAPDLRESPDLNIQLQIDALPDSLIWRYLGLEPPRDGSASFDLDLVASLPFDPTDATDIPFGEMIDAITATGSIELSADGLSFKDGVADLRGGGQADVRFSDRTLEFDARSPITFSAVLPSDSAASESAGDVSRRTSVRLSVANQDDTLPMLSAAFDPEALHGSIAANMRLAPFGETEITAQVHGSTDVGYDGAILGYELAVTEFAGTDLDLPDWTADLEAATLAVSGSADGATGRMYLSTTMRPTRNLGWIESVQAELAGQLEYRGNGLMVVIDEDSTVRLGGAKPFGNLRASNPLTFTVRPERSFIQAEFNDGLHINHRLIAAIPQFSFIDRRSGARAVNGRNLGLTIIGSSAWPDETHDLTAQVSVDRIDFAEAKIRVSDVRGQAVLPGNVDRGKAFANFEAAAVTDIAVPRRIVPLRIAGRLTRQRGAIGLAAKLTDAGGAAEMSVDGRLNDAGGGSADVWIPRIDFATGGLQPRSILPALPTWIGTVEGGLGMKGPIKWGANGVTSDVRVVANNLSMVVGGNEIRGVNGVVEIDGFDPLVTAPQQLIGVKTFDIGVPLTDGKFRFDIGADGRLTIHETSWGLAGGRIGATGVVLDANSETHLINLEANGLDLQSLLNLAELDGVTAGGSVSGRIPVTIRNGQLTIRDGVLETVGGGLLRYRPVPLPAALQQGGETVSLMVKALDNFQYDKLQVKLNRDADGEAALGLHIDGRNPDLYEGYPIEFNLNLTGKLDEILTKGIEIYQIPDAIRGKVEGL